jgi:hypothetical protein
MKTLRLSLLPATALLSSCMTGIETVGYYDGYATRDHWMSACDDATNSHPRHYRTPFGAADDKRLGAGHRTSPGYRDPHHGGSTHGHDAAGHRIDSHGHHVDALGRHSTPGSHSGSSHDRSESSRRERSDYIRGGSSSHSEKKHDHDSGGSHSSRFESRESSSSRSDDSSRSASRESGSSDGGSKADLGNESRGSSGDDGGRRRD